MRLFSTLLLALVACSDASPPASTSAATSPPSAPATASSAPAPTPPPPPPPPPAPLPEPRPCFLRAADLTAALGAPYQEGEPVPPIPRLPMRSCRYDSRSASLVQINATAYSEAEAAVVRSRLSEYFAGTKTPIPNDPDGAMFQMQADIGTCALHYVRGQVHYEVRLMTCRGAGADAKLLRLPRPE